MMQSLAAKCAVLVLSGVMWTSAAQSQSTPESSDGRTVTARPGSVDLQGHRGARGLVPENSLPGFLKALELGVTTLEMDVVIASDQHVVVSHEPWMSSVICRRPNGSDVSEAEERALNLYEMTYAEIAGFDCGARGHPGFPHQRPTAVAKPLLDDVIRVADGYSVVAGRSAPFYNIEIKSLREHDGVYHPEPHVFARLVYDVVSASGAADRVTVQSFDPRALRAVRAIDSTLSVALLVSNEDGFAANIEQLGFRPDIYSPNYRLVDRDLVEAAGSAGIRVVPWTVNDASEMRVLLDLGVDGLITDYPDRGLEAIDAHANDAPRGR